MGQREIDLERTIVIQFGDKCAKNICANAISMDLQHKHINSDRLNRFPGSTCDRHGSPQETMFRAKYQQAIGAFKWLYKAI